MTNEDYNASVDRAIKAKLRTIIEAKIAFLKIDHDSPHEGSTAAWLKRIDDDSQVTALKWVLKQLEKG